MNEQQQEYLYFAKGLAKHAGEIMRRYFNADDAGTIAKDDNSPLTIADTSINQMVIDAVKEKYPDHGVLGEEDLFGEDRDSVWICDPIDGTIPFTHGIPTSVFSLALTIDGYVEVAVVYDPYFDRLVSAVKGHGAWFNDEVIDLSTQKPDVSYELVAFEIWTGSNPEIQDHTVMARAFAAFKQEKISPVYFASMVTAGLLVSTGNIMASVAAAGYKWDLAAQDLIIREAGGIVSDCWGNRDPRNYKGEVRPGIIAARNEEDYAKVYGIIEPFLAEARQQAS